MEYISSILSKIYDYLFPFTHLQPVPPKHALFGPTIVCENPSEIIPDFLYLSDVTVPLNHAALKEHGFTHVLTVTGREFETPLPANIIHHHIRIRDSSKELISAHFESAFNFLEEARLNDGKVLVHCEAGVSRSATVTISYIMRFMNMTLREAFKFVKGKRQIISPNFGFMSQLMMYERSLKKSDEDANKPPDNFLAEYVLNTLGLTDITIEQLQQALVLNDYDVQLALLFLFPNAAR